MKLYGQLHVQAALNPEKSLWYSLSQRAGLEVFSVVCGNWTRYCRQCKVGTVKKHHFVMALRGRGGRTSLNESEHTMLSTHRKYPVSTGFHAVVAKQKIDAPTKNRNPVV